MWNLRSAVEFCYELESATSIHGWHVALTGGCLYKPGDRKDLDLVIYAANLPEISTAQEVWEHLCYVFALKPVYYSKVAICQLEDGTRVDFLMRGEFMLDACRSALPAPGY